MTNSTYKGKILGFTELIQAHKLEIPIIQRDYAQGRKDKKEIRLNFLKALYESITTNNPIKLDFIYGSCQNGAFQPLDGQQRLTTLFLLHWYSAAKDKELFTNTKILLSKFSYETRITSRDFCLALIENDIDIPDSNSNISDLIIDSNWFFLSWKSDPTIDAMLRTIDDIHKQFNKVDNLWEILNKKPNLISFYYVELENIGLTDDLYIKMNARGKLLTPFENFKASLQKKVEDEKWETLTSIQDSFAFKIDTVWTDYFWHQFRKNNTIDEAFMRMIASVCMIRQAIDRTITKAEERTNLITTIQEQPNSIRPGHFTKSSFEYLTDTFNIYEKVYKENTDLKPSFIMWRHSSRKSILSEIVFDDNTYSTVQINSATYTQKILFFAQTEYLKRNNTFNKEKFEEWMRVVRNIVSRGDVDKDGNRPDIVRSPQAFDGAVNLINELSEYCSDIYNNLSTITSLKSQFAKEQIEEEKTKAKLIIQYPNYRETIFSAEDNELLRGRIEFLFYCMDYDKNPENFDFQLFSTLTSVMNTHFNSEDNLNNDLRRALLSIEIAGNYDFYCYWWSYWHIAGATKRRLFDRFRELEYFIYSEWREYFKKLVLELCNKDLEAIATDFTPPVNFPKWKMRMIKEKDLLDKKGKSNYIAISDDNSSCWLLKSKRPRDTDGSYEIK
ncbi:DUF262 domain-containing protein [Cloacibacterium sp. TD35]|uniref:DUF262 domain-containing protein n=1 Tax=Cloacibacterium sp. TD35 TaxID=2976818 RepID=UPI00237EA52E|nr:DUF262 domain-containing protein [Cloacibacterium sp. TD35]WDT68032.1 DUF262 domain-containing protein [Cloacibacterium sp. TD35]